MICNAPCQIHVARQYTHPVQSLPRDRRIFLFPEPQISPSWTVVISRRYRMLRSDASLTIPDFILNANLEWSERRAPGQASRRQAAWLRVFSGWALECPRSPCQGDSTRSSREAPDESKRGSQPWHARARRADVSLRSSTARGPAMPPGLGGCIADKEVSTPEPFKDITIS